MRSSKVLLTGLLLTSLFLSGCGQVNAHKDKVVNGLEKTLNLKKDVVTSLVPGGDTKLTVGEKTITIPKSTMDSTRKLIEANTEIEKAVLHIDGDNVTDENIALITYYAQKIGITGEELLKMLANES